MKRTHIAIVLAALGTLASLGSAQTYLYDDAGRLTGVRYADGRSVSYEYDEADNLVRLASAPIPRIPTAVDVSRNTNTQATVSWSSIAGATGYIIERRLAGTTAWEQVAVMGSTINSYVDNALQAGRSYEYRVATAAQSGQSAYSQSATATPFGSPDIYDGGVVNGASFGQHQPIAAGSIVSIFGDNLGFSIQGDSLVPFTAEATTIPLPTALNNVSVLFNGQAAPLFFVGGQPPSQGANGQLIFTGQINAQVPWEIAGQGLVEVVVQATIPGGNTLQGAPIMVPVAPVAPAIFTFDFGGGRAAALNAKVRPDDGVVDATPAQPEGAFPGRTSQPAPIGGVIVIYCNGLGAVTPAIASGQNSMDALRRAASPVKVFIGGIEAQPDFAGLAPQFVGLNQINVFIPQGVVPGPAVPIVIEQAGVRSREDVTIAVRTP